MILAHIQSIFLNNTFVGTVCAVQWKMVFQGKWDFLIMLNLPCQLNSSALCCSALKTHDRISLLRKFLQHYMYSQVCCLNSSTFGSWDLKKKSRDKASWKCHSLKVWFCLRVEAVASCAEGGLWRGELMPLCPSGSHTLHSSYLRRWDGEEACWLDLINATI